MLEKSPETNALDDRAKISAFVVAYNSESIIGACLAPLSFADELIVIDKSSTDATAAIATHYAQRVIRVPWSPVVEDTRAFAFDQCKHDWILFLDDDECLSAEAIAFIDHEMRAPRADVYSIPLRHYILGVHDERAHYWPQSHPRLFRRGAVSFAPTVHGGYTIHSNRRYAVPPEQGVCIHHLSHRDVAEWIAKANRYTSMQDRVRVVQTGNDLIRFAHERIDFWRGLTRDAPPDSYPIAVALLRATYDIIDRLKGWEQEEGLDGDRAFRDFAAVHQARFAVPGRSAERRAATPQQATAGLSDIVGVRRDAVRDVRAVAELTNHGNIQATSHLRQMHSQSTIALAAEVQAHHTDRSEARSGRGRAIREVEAAWSNLESIRASWSRRLTAPLRVFVARHPGLARVSAVVGARHPSVRNPVWLLRNIWRVATLRPPVSRAALHDSLAAGHTGAARLP